MNSRRDTGTFYVRPADAADTVGIWETHTRAIRELCAQDYSFEQIEAWAGPRKPTDYLGPIEAGRLFVADRSGEIVGFGEFHEGRREICAIYVHPYWVRHGIGRALFERVTNELRTRKVSHAWLDASLTSVDFYTSLSCQRGETKEHRLGGTNVLLSCVRMEVEL